MRLIATAFSLSTIHLTRAVDILGLVGEDCHGEHIFSYKVNTTSSCINVTYFRDTSSIATGSFQQSQRVNLYNTSDCKFESWFDSIVEGSEPHCFNEQLDQVVKSLRVDLMD